MGKVSWRMTSKHESLDVGGLFFCFVDFGSAVDDLPKVYVVPSREVAKAVRESHRAWLSEIGKGGRERQDSDVRIFPPDHRFAYGVPQNPYPLGWLDQYLSRWDLLTNRPAE